MVKWYDSWNGRIWICPNNEDVEGCHDPSLVLETHTFSHVILHHVGDETRLAKGTDHVQRTLSFSQTERENPSHHEIRCAKQNGFVPGLPFHSQSEFNIVLLGGAAPLYNKCEREGHLK